MKKFFGILLCIVIIFSVIHYDTRKVEAKSTTASYIDSISVVDEIMKGDIIKNSIDAERYAYWNFYISTDSEGKSAYGYRFADALYNLDLIKGILPETITVTDAQDVIEEVVIELSKRNLEEYESLSTIDDLLCFLNKGVDAYSSLVNMNAWNSNLSKADIEKIIKELSPWKEKMELCISRGHIDETTKAWILEGELIETTEVLQKAQIYDKLLFTSSIMSGGLEAISFTQDIANKIDELKVLKYASNDAVDLLNILSKRAINDNIKKAAINVSNNIKRYKDASMPQLITLAIGENVKNKIGKSALDKLKDLSYDALKSSGIKGCMTAGSIFKAIEAGVAASNILFNAGNTLEQANKIRVMALISLAITGEVVECQREYTLGSNNTDIKGENADKLLDNLYILLASRELGELQYYNMRKSADSGILTDMLTYFGYDVNDLDSWYKETYKEIVDKENQIILPASTSTKVSEQDLINKVKQKTKKPIYKTFYDDFDGNGHYEAFVLVGTINDYEDNYLDGEVWLSNSKKTTLLTSGSFEIKITNILKLKSTKLFSLGTYAATSWPAELWQIKGYEATKIFQGDAISYSGDDIMSVHSTYDSSLSDGILTGHTWKKYYFYYSKGKIYEYGAKELAEKQFSNIKNAPTILEQIKNKYKTSNISEIFFRKNSTIQINFFVSNKDSKYLYYANLKYDSKNNSVSLLQYGEGSYMAALYPDIAVKPQIPEKISNSKTGTSLTGSMALQADTMYYYDLNGDGKNESIKYSVKQSMLTATVSVYIDGKKVISEEQSAFTYFASISNIDEKDKYLELSLLSYSGDNYMNTLNIYRYLGSSKKLIKLFSFPNSKDLYWLNYSDKVNTTGNGTFTWASGTIHSLINYCEYVDANEGMQPLGACVNLEFNLQDNKISLKSKEFIAYDGNVTTLKKIVLTDKASKNGKYVVSVKSGSSVIIEKIKYIKKGEAYLYIKYDNKNGWFHINEKSGVVFRKK